MREYKLVVPRNQQMEDWFGLINQHLDKVEEVDSLIVDFHQVYFLRTDNFVILACLIESYFINGSTITFIGGTDKFKNHLNNIKFKKYWEKGFDRENFTVSLNRTTLCLWKLTRSKMYGYSMYAKQYFKNTFLNNKDLLPLASNLDEVFNNIFDHSKSPITGYIMTQFYPQKNKLSFAVCDFGIGIPQSINDFREKNDKASIEDWKTLLKSLELGFSVKSTPRNRGLGLNNILDLTESSKGELTIISNNGFLSKRANKNYNLGSTSYSFSGTLVKVELDMNTFENLDATEDFFEF